MNQTIRVYRPSATVPFGSTSAFLAASRTWCRVTRAALVLPLLFAAGMAGAQGVQFRAEITYGESAGGNQILWNSSGWALNLSVDQESDSVEVRSPTRVFAASKTSSTGTFATDFDTVRNEMTTGDWSITYDFEDPEPANRSVFSFTVSAGDDFANQTPLPAQFPAFSPAGVQPGQTGVSLNPTFVWSGDSSAYNWVRFTLFPLVGGPVISGFYDLGSQADPGIFTPAGEDTLAPGTEYFAEVAFGRSVGFLTVSDLAYVSGPNGNLPESLSLETSESFAARMSFTTAIPEPGTYSALAGLAGLGVAWARRRNRSG